MPGNKYRQPLSVDRPRAANPALGVPGGSWSMGVATPSPGNPRSANGSLAASKFAILSGAFGGIAADVGRMADKAAAREGFDAGRLAGQDPEFRTTGLPTIRGLAYDQAGIETFRSRLTHSVSGSMEEAYAKHAEDPQKLTMALDALRAGVEKDLSRDGNLQAAVLPDFRDDFERRKLGYVRAATRAREDRIVSEHRRALTADVDGRVMAIGEQAYRLGLDEAADEVLAGEVDSLTRRIGQIGPNGLPVFDAASATAYLGNVGGSIVKRRIAGAFDRLPDAAAREAFVADLASPESRAGSVIAALPEAEASRLVRDLEKRVTGERRMMRRAELTAYEGTLLGGMSTATEEELADRLDDNEPSPDDPLYDEKKRIYARGEKAVEYLRALRLTDPARAVAEDPAVAMARASRRPGDPASQKAYVLEVLAAQERLGITDPSSVSSEEAMQMFAAIEREPPEKWTAKLGELAAFVGRTYGELGDKVMLDIVRQAASSPDVGRAAAAVIGQLTGGQVKVGALDDMTRAGDIARIGGAIEDGGITFMTGEGEGWQPVGGADPQKEEKPAPFSLAVPPFDAMQALIQSPERAEEFDTVFGPGSADAVLAAKRSADRGKPIGGGRGGVQQPKTWRQLMEDAYPEMKQIRPTDADIEDPAATAGGQDGAELLSDTSAEDLGGDPKGDRLKIPEGGKRGPV